MSEHTWRVLLTRPAAECQALAAFLAEHNIYSSALPLLAIRPLELLPEHHACLANFARYRAVIVVSKPAARLGVAHLRKIGAKLSCAQWFCVGAATAKVLKELGVEATFPQSADDSEALLAMPEFARILAEPNACVLILHADEGRAWLSEQLVAKGLKVDFLALYQRYLPAYAAGTLAAQVKSHALNALVVSSGQGLSNLLEVAGPDWAWLANKTLFVPSPRVAELARLAGAKQVVDCRGASAAALLSALNNHHPALDS